MDIAKLFHFCKTGDLQNLIYLVEEKEVDVNERDKWDSTPLYYACLCGHKKMVKYLLYNGAKCEASTFDGERCLYGALTDEIRSELKKHNMISSRLIRRDMYDEFMRKIQEGNCYEDVIFDVHGVQFPAHKCILSARSEYFAIQFKTRWKDRRVISLRNEIIQSSAFGKILRYLYLGCLETQFDNLDDCLNIAKQCRLIGLIEKIEDFCRRKFSLEYMKVGVRVNMLIIEPQDKSQELKMDLGQLVNEAVPTALKKWVPGELPFEPETSLLYHDVCFQVEDHIFNCHKVFFCGRSDYFKALVEDHFGECCHNGEIPVIKIKDVSVQVFLRVLHYVYQDNCELSKCIVFEVLCAADLYLLPGLKRLCAKNMVQYLEVQNTLPILQTARLFNLPRLESQCAEFIANNLSWFLSQTDFVEFVKEDARSIKEREETDSIDIIDEIRYYISNFVQNYSDMEEAQERLRKIDNFLFELELDG
ncbi:ankyrin repeat and BTB/POZ domain-containing protein 1 [Patella vulgata]|uniref:ankyrin repeat and BTB/POZ domain-containing protein 1 n=1 Tax=Patella vulgata TaxID=6465 RepID=UPI00217F4161|nr:ankyrin repeat and BTB/POZ domain-containing protein 1 [Patella vulgata]